MICENGYYRINYKEEEREAITSITDVLEEKTAAIMRFFCITCFTRKKTIVIWSCRDEYISHLKSCGVEYMDWMVADTFDGNINLLSFDLYRLAEGHQNEGITDYQKILVHEFVHACQQEINPNAKGVIWFWEALATNLSEQRYPLIPVKCTASDLMNRYNEIRGAYAISYTLGRYMLGHCSHEQVLGYVKNPKSLIANTELILRETNTWVRSEKR